jgi:type I restriction enzyme R subunit
LSRTEEAAVGNFGFLEAEWPDLSEEAARAEQHVHADPRAACFYAQCR